MTKLNHDSELYTSLCRQWWPIEVSKPQWPWRSGQSPANRDGADVEGMMTMEVVAGMVVGEGGGARSRGEGGKAGGDGLVRQTW
jgi:hypothetical protein